ncbi:bifunctional diguanylate cyclase/phosphodiesterase [Chitinimonas sp.]|uniref:bifunctional diguanylate cyclase/phosphodiesterase n=1 Tax=Chitinimonas sp. TaxID=1934313 RepID=UPI002F943D12
MRTTSLNFRIVVAFSGLLALVLLLAFTVVNVTNLRISRAEAAQDLQTGERVFRRLLEQRGEQLTIGAQVLAKDFGLRDAIAADDADTLLSALENHGSRIHADLVMLSNLDNIVKADTVCPERAGKPYPFADLLKQASQRGGASGIERIDGKLYQLVAVPVRSPIIIAWVTMGFEINDRTARDLQAVSGLQVSFLGHNGKDWRIQASTLPDIQRLQLAGFLDLGQASGSLSLAGTEYETRLVKLGESPEGPIYVLLAGSLAEVMQPFQQLQRTLIALAIGALLVCLVVGIRIARRITGPLRELAEVAGRIKQGQYQQDIDTRDHSEIGQLADSLSHMQVAIAEREARISTLAYQDPLTLLPNRVRFGQLLEEAIARAKEEGGTLTLLLLDLDRFQQINDTLGHPAGDRLLAKVGERLTESVRSEDVVARLSGDEFAILLPGITIGTAMHSIERVRRSLERRMELDGRQLDVRAGIGAAGFPEHGDNGIDLIRCADMAMYRAKSSGQRHMLYDASIQRFREEHLSLLGELQQAVEHSELTLYYQPKVRLEDGLADEAEALVRWIHPQRGFVPPNEFIPFAEQTGYIKEVTRWVLAHAIRQAGRWAKDGRPVKVSVNLSAQDLLDPGLPATVANLLDLASLAPEWLCLEITESGLMEDPASALDTLKKLRAMGLSLAIDDYGTGYSSLAYIRRLPVNELKIDRAFVLELTQNEGDAQIVRSTIELGHRLGLKVVAEGVEDLATVEVLQAMGCDRIQGYVFGKPMAAEAFERWREQREATAVK